MNTLHRPAPHKSLIADTLHQGKGGGGVPPLKEPKPSHEPHCYPYHRKPTGANRNMIDLKGKVAVVFGLANKRSIAWGIAQKLSEAGATLAICYQNERLKKEADALFATLKETYGTLHTIVHAVAFAPPDAIKNDFLLTTREDFRIAHDVSVY